MLHRAGTTQVRGTVLFVARGALETSGRAPSTSLAMTTEFVQEILL